MSCQVAYGVLSAEKLALLEDGACASLLNCDSYAVFAAEMCHEYTRAYFHKGIWFGPWEVLLRKPGIDDQRVD